VSPADWQPPHRRPPHRQIWFVPEALTYCDMTTSPDGQRLPVAQRLAEIRARYGPEHPVSRALGWSAPELTGAVTRVTRRLADCTPTARTALRTQVRVLTATV